MPGFIRRRMLGYVSRRRRELDKSLSDRGIAHTFSLARKRLHKILSRHIIENAHGTCLDAGSGHSPYRDLLEEHSDKVISIDIEDRSGKIDMIADIQHMPQIPTASVDVILCSQVLEHVPRPWNAICEIARVLRPGGVLILSVPYLSAIHEAPHDYFRYTCFGLRSLCEDAGFEVTSIGANGGLVCFLMHGVSVVFTGTIGSLPGMRWIVWAINYVFFISLTSIADKLLGFSSIYPCDYIVVARTSRC